MKRPANAFDRMLLALRERPSLATRWSGVAYRSTTPAHARSADLISGEGSRRFGGRWNPPGEFAAVYASLDPETAMAETLAHFRYYGIAVQAAMPRVFVAIDVSLARVLDLRERAVQRRIHVAEDSLCDEDWRARQSDPAGSLTQTIGRVAHRAGFEGLVVPSAARTTGANLVAFPDRLDGKSWLRVLGA